jgi:hypothetical protein
MDVFNAPALSRDERILQCVECFNSSLKYLARDLAKRYPGDANVVRAQKRIMTAIDITPLCAIDAAGPYLYTYRKQIYSLNNPEECAEAFFLENSFDDELKASASQERADMASYLILKAKECARTLPPKEKQGYIDLVVALLDVYLEYLDARRAARSC